MAVPSDHDIIHALGEDLPVGLWVARVPNGELIYANKMFAQIMGMGARTDVQVGGYAKPYGIYTRTGDPYPEDGLPFVRALAERTVVVVDDITIHRGDGTHVDVRAFARPVGDPITHVIIAFFDITREVDAERARLDREQQLRHAQRLEAIGSLAGGVAHDFNNLIFGIKLIAAELLIGETDPHRIESLRMIDESTERSASLTRSLLGFARRGKHRSAPVALDDIISGMWELLARTLSGVELERERESSSRATVLGDQTQLEQVVMNLIVNARDALEGTGRVTLRTYDTTTPRGAMVGLEVIDNGPGIPVELRERVFEPYFTTKTKSAERGTGLGLATVFGIVASHNGTIEIADGRDGRGVTMRVLLPAVPTVATTAAPLPAEVRARGSGTVLIVDDDAVVRSALVTAVASLGYQTLAAESGAQAVALYAEHRANIRVVLLDMVMRGMSGHATYLALREIDPGVSVALMSGYSLNDEAQKILDLGVKGFLAKPYSIATLAQTLAALAD